MAGDGRADKDHLTNTSTEWVEMMMFQGQDRRNIMNVEIRGVWSMYKMNIEPLTDWLFVWQRMGEANSRNNKHANL